MTRNTAQLLLILFFALLMLGYGASWFSLHQLWSKVNFSYSHGYLLLMASAWLLYERLSQRDYPLVKPAPIMLPLMFGLSLLWLAANATQILVIQQALLPAIIGCWFTAVFGWRVARSLFFPIVILWFAIPLWDFLILPLREIAVVVTQTVLDVLQIPALIDGFRIHLPVGTFVVAGGCSGLNYLLTGMVVGTLYAYMNLSRWWRRLLIILLVVAFALLANWVRIISLVLIGNASQMQNPLVYEHGAYGWVVFALAMALFFILGHWLKKGDHPPPREVEKGQPVDWARLVKVAVATSAVGLMLPLWSLWQQQSVAQQNRVLSLDELRWQPLVASWQPAYRGYDDLQAWQQRQAEPPLQLMQVIYRSQQQGKELINDMNEIVAENRLLAPARTLTISPQLAVRQLLIRQAPNDRLQDTRVVWWYYLINGQATVDDWYGKWLQLRGILSGQASASLIVVSFECTRASCEQGVESLKASGQLQQVLHLPLGGN